MLFWWALCLGIVGNPIDDHYVHLQGRSVQQIDVRTPTGPVDKQLRALVDIQPGDLFIQESVQQAILRLYALGRFSQVRVEATEYQDSVHLRFLLHPLQRLEELRIQGAGNMDTDKFIKALELQSQDEIYSYTAHDVHLRALAYLERNGYPLAQVFLDVRAADEPGFVNYTLKVTQGPAVRIAAIEFVGHPRVPRELLINQLSIRPGDVLSQDAVQENQKHLLQTYIDRGFRRARMRPAKIIHEKEGARILFHIDAGTRIAFAFTGNLAFSDDELMQLWPEPTGSMQTASVAIFAQRIEQAYSRLSYVDTKVRYTVDDDPLQQQQRITLTIDEGQPVYIQRVVFPGAHALPAHVLQQQVRALLLHELDNQDFFEPLTKSSRKTATQNGHGQINERSAVHVPMQHRWVLNLYQQVADNIAAAYHDWGYLNAQIRTPRLISIKDLATDAEFTHDIEICPNLTSLTRVVGSRICDAAVRIDINEGVQTFIESIAFSGNQAVRSDTLLNQIRNNNKNSEISIDLLPGGPFSPTAIEDGRIAMIRYYRDQGYLYARVFSHTVVSEDGLWGRVEYNIEEGPQVHVQRVLLRGNQYTRPGVVRSRLNLQTGDVYRLQQALNDQRSIAELGTFNTVRVKLLDEERPSSSKDMLADLQERNRQAIEIAPGISTINGPRLKLSYSHINVAGTASTFVASLRVNRQIFFPLFGEYATNLSNRYASYKGIQQLTKAVEREGRLGMRSPRLKFLPFDPLLRLDLVDQRINAVRYSLNSSIAIFGIDLHMPWSLKPSWEVQLALTNLECPLGDACSQNLTVRHLQGGRPIQEGEIRSVKFGPQLLWDQRDNPLNPHHGFLISAHVAQDFGQAKPLETFVPFAFTKYEANLTGYLPLGLPVLAISARGGTIGIERSSVPIEERFFLGGRDSLRGFIESALIPQDACVVQDTDATLPAHCVESISALPGPPLSLGGNTYLLLKTELRVPIRGNLWLDLFADIGNLWVALGSQSPFAIRVGTGAGLRYATPVGALAIDFGVNPARRTQNAEPLTQLHFSIGNF